jgi:arylsulfatase A-like enzyme
MSSSFPNIIVILTDDQGCWALGCAGNSELQTPDLDRLAATGIRFENFFCVTPVCSAARASLLTGRIASQHGVHDWIRAGNSTCEPECDGHLVEFLKGLRGYTDYLAEVGYVCALSGKWHLGDTHHPQKSFSYWNAHARGGGDYYRAPMVKNESEIYFEKRYITDVITDNALAFLEQQRDDRAPFYLSVNYTAPHSPWDRRHHPAEYFDPYYNNCPFASVPDEPMHPMAGHTDFFSTPERRREKLAGYYAAVTAMDANVGRILDWLETHGLREDTLVLFSSDNGMNMGHHGICGKGNGTYPLLNMYDTSVKVPMIASRPGHVPSGVVNSDMLSHYDVFPTLLEYAGLPVPESDEYPGRSFASLLRGTGVLPHDAVVVFDEYGPTRMIRTATDKYVHRFPGGPHEYYDLADDPDERVNLINDPAHQVRINELRGELHAWFARYVVPELDGSTKAVTGRGQLDLASTPQSGDVPFAQDWQKSWW